VSKTN